MMVPFFLYIDPGTGSMLFSIAIGIATAAVFAFRALMVKVRFVLSGGKREKISHSKIPYVIFSDHKRYWNVFKPICDEFERRKIPLVFYTQSQDDPALSMPYEFVKSEYIGEGNKGFVRMNMLNAGVVMATTPGLDVLQWKRSKNVDKYIHIPHSCDDLAGYRMFALDFYDALYACGQNQIDFARKLETVRNSKAREMVLTGSTFMDNAKKQVKKLPVHTLDIDHPVILMAPTWGDTAILSRFGEKILNSLVETGFEIICRPHPQSFTAEKELLERLMAKYPQIEWNRDNNNLDVLNRADLLITDFSGIIMDWTLLFNRPFMYADTHFDPSVYDGAWFDEKFWIHQAAEKMGIQLSENLFGDMKKVLLDALQNEGMKVAREECASQAWGNIGKSAETIVDLVTKG